jgi:hypothetical protein
MGLLVMTLHIKIATTQRILRNINTMTYFQESSISFLSICGYHNLNKFNDGYSVFADRSTTNRQHQPPNNDSLVLMMATNLDSLNELTAG